jgi:hypothetical protein
MDVESVGDEVLCHHLAGLDYAALLWQVLFAKLLNMTNTGLYVSLSGMARC